MDTARDAGIKAPALIVVGEVVRLRDTLQWFEHKPLLGKRIVVTRARAQASDLVGALADLGATCLEIPTIRVVAPDSWLDLDNAIAKLPQYDWLVFTSVNGVHFFFERLFAKGMDTRALGNMRTAAIGPATARCMRQFGLNTDILPKTYQAESVVEAFASEQMDGKRVLLPRARQARPILPDELGRMGAIVDEVPAYQTIQDSDGIEMLVEQLGNAAIDMVTFTSSSTVQNFHALLPEDARQDLMRGVTIACIGPITAETAKSLGYEVSLVASSFTIEGLSRAIVEYYTG